MTNKKIKNTETKKSGKKSGALNEYKIEPHFKDIENTVAVAFSSSDYYAPYLSALLLSLAAHTSQDTNYDIVVFTRDMSDFNQKYLKSLIEKKNISLRFLNVSKLFENKQLYVPFYLTLETYFRIMAPLVFANYPKVLFVDSDTLILSDIKELYFTDIEKYPLAAAEELLLQATFNEAGINIPEFMKTLGLKDARRYFQAGVILFNCKYCNENNFSERLLKNISSKNYKIVDQDALNEICADKHLLLSNKWNFAPCKRSSHLLQFMPADVKEKYMSVKSPKLVHFVGMNWKPWTEIDCEYDYVWWSYAKQTIYYEEILRRLSEFTCSNIVKEHNSGQILRMCINYAKNRKKYLFYKVLSKLAWGGVRQKWKAKSKELKEIIRQTRRYLKGL